MVILGIVLTLVAGGLIAIHTWRPDQDTDDKITSLVVGTLLFAFVVLFYSLYASEQYKQGQINALINKVEYHLVTKSDSTRVWERIEE